MNTASQSPPALWLMGMVVGIGGGLGSILRWQVGLWLNPMALPFAAGTLAVNCIGGLLIGLLGVWFEFHPSTLGRLALMTGLMGGLTTFSTFSAESLSLLLRGQLALALGHSVAHLLGALCCVSLGWGLGRLLWA